MLGQIEVLRRWFQIQFSSQVECILPGRVSQMRVRSRFQEKLQEPGVIVETIHGIVRADIDVIMERSASMDWMWLIYIEASIDQDGSRLLIEVVVLKQRASMTITDQRVRSVGKKEREHVSVLVEDRSLFLFVPGLQIRTCSQEHSSAFWVDCTV